MNPYILIGLAGAAFWYMNYHSPGGRGWPSLPSMVMDMIKTSAGPQAKIIGYVLTPTKRVWNIQSGAQKLHYAVSTGADLTAGAMGMGWVAAPTAPLKPAEKTVP